MARTSYLVAPGTTAEQLADQREYAAMLLKGATDTSPKGHWAHIPAQALQGLLGGIESGEIGNERRRQADEAGGLFGEAYDAMRGAPAAVPVPGSSGAPSIASAAPAPISPAQGAAAAAGRTLPAPDLDYADATRRIMGVESGGRADARNPLSSATGGGQFIDSTWLEMMRKNRPDLVAGKTPEQILAMRGDWNLSRDMTEAYARSNGEQLRAAGMPVTAGSVRLAHLLGPAGAKTVMSTGANVPLAEVLPQNVLAANPFMRDMNAGTLRRWADRQMTGPVRGAPASIAAPAAPGATSIAAAAPGERGLAERLYRNEATRPLAGKMLEARLARQNKKPEIVTIELGNGQKRSMQQMPDGRLLPIDMSSVGGAGGGELPPNFDDTQKLRKEFQSQTAVKKFDDAAGPYASMLRSAAQDTATADIDMVYGLATILDPESVVREGEFATIRAAQSIPDRFKGEIQYLFEGKGRLSAEAREKLMEIAANRMNSYRTQAMGEADRFRGLAKSYGMNGDLVSKNFPEVEIYRRPAVGQPETRPNVQKLEWGPDGKLRPVQ